MLLRRRGGVTASFPFFLAPAPAPLAVPLPRVGAKDGSGDTTLPSFNSRSMVDTRSACGSRSGRAAAASGVLDIPIRAHSARQ